MKPLWQLIVVVACFGAVMQAAQYGDVSSLWVVALLAFPTLWLEQACSSRIKVVITVAFSGLLVSLWIFSLTPSGRGAYTAHRRQEAHKQQLQDQVAERQQREEKQREAARVKEDAKEAAKQRAAEAKTKAAQSLLSIENIRRIATDVLSDVVPDTSTTRIESIDLTRSSEGRNVRVVFVSRDPSTGAMLLNTVKKDQYEESQTQLRLNAIRADMTNLLGEMTQQLDMSQVAQVDITVTASFVDVYGHTAQETAVKAIFNRDTLKRINFDGFDSANILVVADDCWIHPAFDR